MTYTAKEITNNRHCHHHPRYFTVAQEEPREAKRMNSFGFLGGWLRLVRFTAAAVSDGAPLQTKAISPLWGRGGGDGLGKLKWATCSDLEAEM